MIPDLTSAEIARFYSKIRLEGCGLRWAGPVNGNGYGRFEFYRAGERRRVLAHRLAFKLFNGCEPGRAMVRHGCDIPSCCTPDCLSSGTQTENMRDAAERGRANLSGLAVRHQIREAAIERRLSMGEKRCSRCRETKPFGEFRRHKGNRDGHQYQCKTCQRRYLKHERSTS